LEVLGLFGDGDDETALYDRERKRRGDERGYRV